jgi:hypothetical protein
VAIAVDTNGAARNVVWTPGISQMIEEETYSYSTLQSGSLDMSDIEQSDGNAKGFAQGAQYSKRATVRLLVYPEEHEYMILGYFTPYARVDYTENPTCPSDVITDTNVTIQVSQV